MVHLRSAESYALQDSWRPFWAVFTMEPRTLRAMSVQMKAWRTDEIRSSIADTTRVCVQLGGFDEARELFGTG